MSMWDERYAAKDLVYGAEPNRWLVEQAGKIRPGGRVLSIGEGEGRNGVWLAAQGFQLHAVDGSRVGLEKARRLAAARGVTISTSVEDLATFRPAPASYDAVVAIFVHLPPAVRTAAHAAAEAALVSGGVLVIEAFTPRQLGFTSGGPKQKDMLYGAALLRADFPGIAWEVLEEVDVVLDEGAFHQGPAAVVRGVGRRTP
jgi:cyclopropane fatty-acyl-phospholipid synthase-like methyltransferase